MPMRRTSTIGLLLCLAAGLSAQGGTEAASFSRQSDGVPLTSLDGLWRFHAGDSPVESVGGASGGGYRWAEPSFNDSDWSLLRGDAPWSSQGLDRWTGYGWYRFKVTVPNERRRWAILLPPIAMGYEIFADGVRIGAAGSYRQTPIPLLRVAVVNNAMYLLPEVDAGSGWQEGQAESHTYQIALRVWAQASIAQYYFAGPAHGGGVVGAAAPLRSMLVRRHTQELNYYTDNFAFALLAEVIAIFSLGLFWFRREDTEYLWFALMPIVLGLDALLTIVFVIYLEALPLWDLINSALQIAYQLSLLLFISRVLGKPLSRLRQAIILLGALSILTVPLYWTEVVPAPIAGWVGIMMLLPAMLWVLWKLARESVHGNITARLLLLPVVLMTGLSLLDDITLTLNQFHLIQEAEPFEHPISVVGFRMHPTILAQTLFLMAMMGFLTDRFTRARRREERMVASLEAARQVQRLLLPESMPQVPGLRIECVYQPAEMVGGDFFLTLPTEDGGLMLLLGDVSGKGLPASMLVAMLVGAARSQCAITTDPASILCALNAILLAHHSGRFATCLVCHIAADGATTMASAGHPGPYRNGQEVELQGALPLGIAPLDEYENHRLVLQADDRLVLVSDGVVEAQDAKGNLLGFDAVARLASLTAQQIAAAALNFGQDDDITVLAVERVAGGD